MVKTSDDVQLIIDAQTGCESALNQLAIEVQRKVYPALYRMTQDSYLAQDLLQETLLVMLQSLKKLKRIEGFWGWIYTIARSRFCDYLRKKRSSPSESLTDLEIIISNNNNSALEVLIDKERDEFLIAAISNLKKRYQDIVNFRHFENRSYSEVASMSQCTTQQARVRFFRAKQSLRKALSEMEYEFDQ